MALFSEGIDSFPDNLIVVVFISILLISSILNPIVFLYNSKRTKSVPACLYRTLAACDFVTTLIFCTNSVVRIGRREDTKCRDRPEYGPINSGPDLSFLFFCDYHDDPNKSERFLSTLLRGVAVFPSCLTATLVVCRYIKIVRPFQEMKMKVCLGFPVIGITYIYAIYCLLYFDKNAIYDYTTLSVINLGYFHPMKYFILSHLFSEWPYVIAQLVSIVVSALTILHLLKPSPQRLSKSAPRRHYNKTKTSIKIIMTNSGNVLMTLACLSSFLFLVVLKDGRFTPSFQGMLFVIFGLIPPFLSAVNPVIFIIMTPKVIHRSTKQWKNLLEAYFSKPQNLFVGLENIRVHMWDDSYLLIEKESVFTAQSLVWDCVMFIFSVLRWRAEGMQWLFLMTISCLNYSQADVFKYNPTPDWWEVDDDPNLKSFGILFVFLYLNSERIHFMVVWLIDGQTPLLILICIHIMYIVWMFLLMK